MAFESLSDQPGVKIKTIASIHCCYVLGNCFREGFALSKRRNNTIHYYLVNISSFFIQIHRP